MVELWGWRGGILYCFCPKPRSGLRQTKFCLSKVACLFAALCVREIPSRLASPLWRSEGSRRHFGGLEVKRIASGDMAVEKDAQLTTQRSEIHAEWRVSGLLPPLLLKKKCYPDLDRFARTEIAVSSKVGLALSDLRFRFVSIVVVCGDLPALRKHHSYTRFFM